MIPRVVALLPLLSLAFSAAVPNKPSFCRQLDCPHFTVIETTSDYELRSYNETKWVAVQREAGSRRDVKSQMFRTLFKYIGGENVDGAKIPMTAPVMTTVAEGVDPNMSTFTMHFMVPHDLQSSPVAPTDPTVRLVTMPAMDVYVRSFGGYASEADYREQKDQLMQALSPLNVQVDTSLYYTAGYDSPWRFFNRHNEVWLRKM